MPLASSNKIGRKKTLKGRVPRLTETKMKFQNETEIPEQNIKTRGPEGPEALT